MLKIFMFIYGTYVLGGMQMQNFLRVIQMILMEFIAGRFFTKQASNFYRKMINCMRAWNYVQKTSGSPLSIETIKQTHKIMMDNEEHRNGKDVLVAGYRKFVCIYKLSYFCTSRPINIQREGHGTVTIGHVGYNT